MKATTAILLALIATAGVSARELQHASSSTASASVSCTATSSSGVDTVTANTITKTVAKASASAFCGAVGSVDAAMAEAVVAWRGAAKAIVDEWTAASAHCTTGDNSFACAHSVATARGHADAIQLIFSNAVAAAVGQCGHCTAAAKAQVSASTVVQLFAKASGRAQADICIGPDATASAAAFQACTASVVAHGFALANARAFIRGGCTNLDAGALARVRTISRVDPLCMCKGWVYSCAKTAPHKCTWGLSKDSVMGRARAVRELNVVTSNNTLTADAFFVNECQALAKQIKM